MSQTFNLQGRPLGNTVVSVTCWFYSAPWPNPTVPQPPTPMPATPAEDATAQTAHFVVFEGFDRANGRGNSSGRGAIDTGAQTALEYAQAQTVEELLAFAFPSV